MRAPVIIPCPSCGSGNPTRLQACHRCGASLHVLPPPATPDEIPPPEPPSRDPPLAELMAVAHDDPAMIVFLGIIALQTLGSLTSWLFGVPPTISSPGNGLFSIVSLVSSAVPHFGDIVGALLGPMAPILSIGISVWVIYSLFNDDHFAWQVAVVAYAAALALPIALWLGGHLASPWFPAAPHHAAPGIREIVRWLDLGLDAMILGWLLHRRDSFCL